MTAALACRYGDLDKIKSLIRRARINKKYSFYDGCDKGPMDIDVVNCEFVFIVDMYSSGKLSSYSFTGDRDFLTYLSAFEPFDDLGVYMYTDNSGEIRSYKPLDPEERFRCICFFLKRTLFKAEIKPWKCFYGYILDISEPTRNALAKGANFSVYWVDEKCVLTKAL